MPRKTVGTLTKLNVGELSPSRLCHIGDATRRCQVADYAKEVRDESRAVSEAQASLVLTGESELRSYLCCLAMAGRHVHDSASSRIANSRPSPKLIGQDEVKIASIRGVFCPPDLRPAVAVAFWH